MPTVFISYKREERQLAKQLADELARASWQVWWDPHLRAGERFDDAIEAAILDAVAVIVLWSKRSITSQYVKDEANFALRLGKLVPVAVDGTDPPFRFQNLHTVRIDDWTTSPPGPEFDVLLRDLSSIAGTPPGKRSDQRATQPAPAAKTIAGSWEGQWRSIRSGRLHHAVLSIPEPDKAERRAVLEVTYERAGQKTELLESLALTEAAGTVTLIGRHYDYVNKGASTSYSLDNFSLRLSDDGDRLEGVAYLANGERNIVFVRRHPSEA